MKKQAFQYLLFLVFFSMTTHLNAQWKTSEGIKEKEIHFSPTDMNLKWIEYDEYGKIENSGESRY